MSKRNRTFGGVRKRSGIKHLVITDKGAMKDKRERRLNRLHLAKAKCQLAGMYSPELPHVVTRRRSSACQVIALTRMIPSGSDNLSLGVVAR